jgi:GT2 family glycosyltransferase
MKQLSIIIVNFNTADFIAHCIESLAAGGHVPSSWEIIIVDNNSNENDQQQILSSKKKYKHIDIHVINNTENTGFSKANNIGIAKSSGKYVLLLNPDTIVSPDTFKRLIEYLEKHEKVAIVTPRIVLPSGELDDASHRGFPTPWNAFCYFSGLSSLFPHTTFLNGYHMGYQNMDKTHEIDACVGACMMVRRSVGEKLHWLDEDFFWNGEDLDFCYRIQQAGHSIMFVPEVAITHFKGVSSGIKKQSQAITTASRETKKRSQKARFEAMRIFYKKHYVGKYPSFVTWLALQGIGFFEKIMS